MYRHKTKVAITVVTIGIVMTHTQKLSNFCLKKTVVKFYQNSNSKSISHGYHISNYCNDEFSTLLKSNYVCSMYTRVGYKEWVNTVERLCDSCQ